MQVLVLGPDEKDKIAKVVAYSEECAHWYVPDKSAIPGDVPAHVAVLGTYRCVFSITVGEQSVYRHLSISVPQKGRFPLPYVAFEIASLFGLTGWEGSDPPKDWLMDANEYERCVVIAQQWAPPEAVLQH